MLYLPYLPVEVMPEPTPPPRAASDRRIEIALSSGHRMSALRTAWGRMQ